MDSISVKGKIIHCVAYITMANKRTISVLYLKVVEAENFGGKGRSQDVRGWGGSGGIVYATLMMFSK